MKINKNGFTLVELLIVIALIAILSVAVLATINPIEQANKANDSTVQNDAAEVMNAYERYYANAQKYPWMTFTDSDEITIDDAKVYDSTQPGFGICYANSATEASDGTGECNTSTANLGVLISTDELKASFAGKNEFKSANEIDRLWAIKMPSSSGGVYVCYVPKAKASRQLTDKLYCINSTATDSTVLVKAGEGNCVALALGSAWSTPVLDGTAGMFRCVPE